jgi:superoxide dismutase, Fe-Mn family
VEGNGWGVLAWQPRFGRLYTLAYLNHQGSQLTGALPLLLCDVWEHAYYLKYQNRRADYVTAWWNVVDWADVEQRFAAARSTGL